MTRAARNYAMDKRAYVRQAAVDHRPSHHTCHWPDCKQVVPPAMWGCKIHWFRLPSHLRKLIWATYKPGQEIDKTPSRDYVRAARAVQDWIERHGKAA